MKFLLIALLTFLCIKAEFYRKYYKEAASIVRSMTLSQKIGQTVEIDALSLL